MARFVDLEIDEDQDPHDGSLHTLPVHDANLAQPLSSSDSDPKLPHERAPTTPMARALGCYPIVIGIVSSIDLTTLDSLARTNRAVHDSLIQYRSALIASTLRCMNEQEPIDRDETLRYRAARSHDNWAYMDAGRSASSAAKAGNCARDMVGECRRCAKVICRNCAIKPPAPVALRERHRRLCKTCVRAPLTSLACPRLDGSLSLLSDAVQDSICKCEVGGVWLCQPCGRTIRNADNDYQCIWRWRNHYGESLGCLGTGIGDGDRGVICGREQKCLAAREREQEMDCDAEDAKGSVSGSSPGSSPDYLSRNSPLTPSSHATSYFPVTAAPQQSIESLVEEYRYQERTPSPLLGPGYERHEIEGIGGIVKRKIVRMVRIGACVPEWEDEKSHYNVPSASRVLGHEVRGEIRSWCGWCLRVVPGQKDRENMVRNQTIADGKVQTRFQQNVVQMPLRNGQQQHETKARVCPPVSS